MLYNVADHGIKESVGIVTKGYSGWRYKREADISAKHAIRLPLHATLCFHLQVCGLNQVTTMVSGFSFYISLSLIS